MIMSQYQLENIISSNELPQTHIISYNILHPIFIQFQLYTRLIQYHIEKSINHRICNKSYLIIYHQWDHMLMQKNVRYCQYQLEELISNLLELLYSTLGFLLRPLYPIIKFSNLSNMLSFKFCKTYPAIRFLGSTAPLRYPQMYPFMLQTRRKLDS